VVNLPEFTVSTSKKYDMVDVTDKVKEIVKKSKINDGIVNVYVTHATAAIVINENYDPNVCTDVLNALDKLVPEGRWLHDRVDGNAASHIKASILGPSETVPVREGKLQLGTWQSIMLVELDGPRSNRRVVVSVVGA